MKRLIIYIFGFVLILLYSCSKEMIEPDQAGDLKDLTCGKYEPNKPHGPVFTVAPSENATQALIDAFIAAKEAGPGAVVQLEEGQYTIGVIDVRDFDGYFVGKGRGKTIISNLPDLPCDAQLEANLTPTLMRFTGGNVTVANLTFHLNDGNPCKAGGSNDDIYGELASILVLADYGNYVPANRYIKGVVDNVDFIGGNDGNAGVYGTPGNVAMPLYVGADFMFPPEYMPVSHLDISLTRCYFELGLVGPDFWSSDENSHLYIANNIMKNNMLAGAFLGFCQGSNCIVENNQFINTATFADLYIDNNDQGYYTIVPLPVKRTNFTIKGNKFQSLPGAISMYLSDYSYGTFSENNFPQLFNIMSNNITTQEGGIAIMGSNFVNAKIWNNRFSGTGSVGIMLDGTEATNRWAENNKIMGNNFLNATYTGGNVYLGPFTKNCMVVGVSTDKVVDFGVNNSVIGVKAQKKGPHYNPGMHGHFKNMQENMMRMRAPEID
jgi:hypothetical protein